MGIAKQETKEFLRIFFSFHYFHYTRLQLLDYRNMVRQNAHIARASRNIDLLHLFAFVKYLEMLPGIAEIEVVAYFVWHRKGQHQTRRSPCHRCVRISAHCKKINFEQGIQWN